MKGLPAKPLHIRLSLLLALVLLASSTADAHKSIARPTRAVAADAAATAAGWVTLPIEDFESGFPGDKSAAIGDPTWDDEAFRPHWGQRSAWCAGGGSLARDPAVDDYANGMWAHMIFGPYDLSDASAATVGFYRWMATEQGFDYFRVEASANMDIWGGWNTWYGSGYDPQWKYFEIDLANVPDLGNLCGERYVWIKFTFESDSSVTDQGVFVDDITLRKLVAAADSEPPQITNVRQSADIIYSYDCGEPQSLTISADVLDPGSGVASVHVHFQRPGGTWDSREMYADGSSTYEAVIGPFWEAGTVQYRVQAEDNAGNTGWSDGEYTFAVFGCDTPTDTPTQTLVPTNTPTRTPTQTPVPTNTSTRTQAPTPTRTQSPAPTATQTMVPTSPVLLGNTSCTWGSRDCNPCANTVVAAFNSLRYQGDILGFNLGDHPDPVYELRSFWSQHWQGIQRIAAGDGRTMVVSHDNVNLTYSVLGVVRLDSRNGSGDRYRSNRLLRDFDISDTIPWSGDVIAQTVWIDDVHAHPGSIQSMGSYLVVGTGEEIHLYDFQNPLSPQHLGPADSNAWDGIGQILYRSGKSGSSTAMGQLQDGRYLLVVANSDAKDLDFYVSQQPYSLRQPGTYPTFQEPYRWVRSQVSMGQGEFTFLYDWDTFQNISLVTECGSGQLYLVATGNLDLTADCSPMAAGFPCWPDGQDWASLYQVQLVGGQIVITKVAERWFDCEYRGQRYCNFDAAAGIYADPQGQLILYATEHASSGPANSVNMMEFRPMPPGRCDSAEGAWVELHKEPGYFGRSIMIDYADRDLENYSNYDKVEDFEDQASSVRWCLPPGLSYVLWQDKEPCGGGMLQLFGDGSMHGIPYLSQYGWDHPDGGRVSCSYFWPVTPVAAQINAITGGTLVYNTLQPSGGQGSDALVGAVAGSVAAQDWSTMVQIPPGALAQSVELTYTPRFPPQHDPQPLLSPGYAFDLSTQAGGVPLEDLTLSAPAEITIHYDGTSLSEMVNESTLILGLYDGASGSWIDASTTCGLPALREHSPDEDWLRVGICRIGEMALLGEPVNRFMRLPIVLKAHAPGQRPRPAPTPTPPAVGSFLLADSGQLLGNTFSWAVSLGDADGDGDLDAFIGAIEGDGMRLWFNDGSGVFHDSGQQMGYYSGRGIGLGDLDGDGDLDAFAANCWGDPNTVWLNDGAGSFADSGQRLGQGTSTSVGVGDLDGDGDIDAYVGNYGEPDQVWLNDGAARFHAGQAVSESNTEALALGDVDGDGDLDAVCAHEGQPNRVRINTGAGRFDESRYLGEANSRGIALGDLDGDGDLDVFMGNGYRFEGGELPNEVWLNDGAGHFSDSGQRLGQSDSGGVALGDLDGDGDLDAFVANYGQPCQVWLNDGHGSLHVGQQIGEWHSDEVALGDLDGDGDLDVWVANNDGQTDRVIVNLTALRP